MTYLNSLKIKKDRFNKFENKKDVDKIHKYIKCDKANLNYQKKSMIFIDL